MEYFRNPDYALISHIMKVEILREFQPRSLSVVIIFSENDYFTNLKLMYQVILKPESEDQVQEVKGCQIDWKEGRDLVKKKIRKMQMNSKTKEQRTVVTSVQLESFFNIFETKVSQ